MAMRQVQKHLPRGGGADFLVRIDQHRAAHLPERRRVGCRQGAQGKDERREAALHVHHARTGGARSVDPEGAGGRRARRKDGVHVADAEERPGRCRTWPRGEEVVAEFRLREPLHRKPEVGVDPSQLVRHPVHGRPVVRPAILVDQRLQERNRLRVMRLEPPRDRLAPCGHGCPFLRLGFTSTGSAAPPSRRPRAVCGCGTPRRARFRRRTAPGQGGDRSRLTGGDIGGGIGSPTAPAAGSARLRPG